MGAATAVLLALIPDFSLARAAGALVVAGVVLALLWDARPVSTGARLRSLVMTGIAVMLFWGFTAPPPAGAEARDVRLDTRELQSSLEIGLLIRQIVLLESLPASTGRTAGVETAKMVNQAARRAPQALADSPASPRVPRLYGILYGLGERWDDARRMFQETDSRLRQDDPERADREAALWASLYGEEAPSVAQIEVANAEMQALELGWVRDVVLLTAYRRAGDEAAAKSVAERARWESLRALAPLSVMMLGGVLLLLAGVVLLVVGLVLRRRGRLHAVQQEFEPVGPVLVESVIVLLLLLAPPLARVLMHASQAIAPPGDVGMVTTVVVAHSGLEVIALGYLAVALRLRGVSLAEIGLHGRAFWRNVGAGLVGWVAGLPLWVGLAMLAAVVAPRVFPEAPPPSHPVVAVLASPQSAWVVVLMLVAGAIIAPVMEEIFFRGALYGGIRRRWGVWPGVILSSGLFAALHPQGPVLFLPMFALGAAFCLLYEWRKSLVPGIVAHAVHNALLLTISITLFPTVGG